MEPKVKLAAALLVIGLLILLAAPAIAQGRSMVAWWALTGGGGFLQNGDISVNGSLGQRAAGMLGEAHHELCAGQLCYTMNWDRQYIPVAQSDFAFRHKMIPVMPQVVWPFE